MKWAFANKKGLTNSFNFIDAFVTFHSELKWVNTHEKYCWQKFQDKTCLYCYV